MNYEEFEECQESIYRGETCLACDAKWNGHALDHYLPCSYLQYIDDHGDYERDDS